MLGILSTILLGSVFGCAKKTVPDPSVERFLNTEISAQKAFDAVDVVDYTVTEQQTNKAGEVNGGYTFIVHIDKTDPKHLCLHISQEYVGNYVSEGVFHKEVLLERVNGTYCYTTQNGSDRKTEEVEDSFATDYVTSFFYVNNNAYNEGGLYYGDFFMLYIYKYPATSFYVDNDTGFCVFDEKMDIQNKDTGNVHLHQVSKINRLGLLETNYERYESVNTDFVLCSELKATYTYHS